MRLSRRELTKQNARLTARRDELAGVVDEAVRNERATATQLLRVAGELSRAKDVIASHLVAAGHPSTVLHDVKGFAESLRQALAAAGVDLRLELARLEGADL